MTKLFYLLMLTLFLFSCSENAVNENTQDNTENNSITFPNKVLVNWLIETGFSEESIIDQGESFIVEGDIIFEKEDLLHRLDKKQKQRSSPFLVRSSKVENIIINTNGLSGKGSWADNFSTAVTYWNQVSDSKLHFTIDNNATNPDITVETFLDEGGNLEEGEGKFPDSNQNPGDLIRFGYDSSLNSNYNSIDIYNERITTAMHELGHSIGLAHTDATSFSHITGTLVDDSSSVMITDILVEMTTNFKAYETLSTNDKKAVEILYPFPAPSSSPPSAPVLSSTFDANNWIELNWTIPSSDEPITGYLLVRTNTGYQGTISDGNNFYTSSTNSKKDYPFIQPDYDNFVSGTFGFACYAVKAESSAGISSSSNQICYGVESSGGGF